MANRIKGITVEIGGDTTDNHLTNRKPQSCSLRKFVLFVETAENHQIGRASCRERV